VFENAEFIQWAAENVVFLVGYKGHDHKRAEPPAGDAKEKPAPKEGECSLYPGLTCDEHEKIMADAMEGKGGPKLAVTGYPTSYVIAPDGTFERHSKDRVVRDLIDGVADFAKKAKVKPSKKYQGVLNLLKDGDKAAGAGKWRDALACYVMVDAVAKKLPSVGAQLPERVATLNEKVVEAFARLRDDEATDLGAKVKAIRSLRAQVGAKLSSGPLPVVAELDAWLKANPPPAPTPRAK